MKNGIVIVKIFGNANESSVSGEARLAQEIEDISAELRSLNKAVLLYCDVSKLESSNSHAQKVFANHARHFDLDRCAIMGGKRSLKRVFQSIALIMLGMSKFHFFTTEESAIKWLKGGLKG